MKASAPTQTTTTHRCGTPRQRQRFGGRRIHQRPGVVETRQRVGEREGDTIVGKGLARIVTLVERKTGLVRLRRVANGEAESTMRAIVHALYPLCARVHTLTWDNGREFAEHALIDIVLGATSYFAAPYSSWQRGSNENLIGLVRQYLPKGCDLGTITDTQLQQIEDRLNQRPRRASSETSARVARNGFTSLPARHHKIPVCRPWTTFCGRYNVTMSAVRIATWN